MEVRALNKAKKQKADEFYTQMVDIENELRNYKTQFRGKTIFCNCDDPYESNFFKYFAMNFNHLGLKKLIATCYVRSPIEGEQLSLENIKNLKKTKLKSENGRKKHPHKIEILEVTDENQDGAVDLADVEILIKNKKNILTLLKGDGDFRSEECIELLKESDIVVTNPPFSLFREYVAQLINYKKKFLIIGNVNAITYKEIFKFIKTNKLWLGYNNGGTKWFRVPMEYETNTSTGIKIENGIKYFSAGNVNWFTNLEVKKHNEFLSFYRKYTPEEYPKYDNYDAIEVSKVADIPYDYDGIIGVPITFIDKYNPEQFEIIKFRKGNDEKDLLIHGKCPYFRILIKRIGGPK